MTTEDKVKILRDYVNENYNKGGFDWIAECWGKAEMTEFIEKENPKATVEQLQRKLKKIAKNYGERESEVLAEIW